VVESGGGGGFSFETGDGVGACGTDNGGQHLEGNGSVERGLDGAINNAHAALSDDTDDSISFDLWEVSGGAVCRGSTLRVVVED